MDFFKRTSGIYFPIAVFAAVNLLFLTLARAALGFWQWERMSAGTDYWPGLLWGGFRLDLSMFAWIVLVLVSLTFLFGIFAGTLRVWNKILRVILVVLTAGFLFMEAATPAFVETYDLRPNRLFVEYLTNPKEVFAMLLAGHFWASFLTIFLTAAGIAGAWFASGTLFEKKQQTDSAGESVVPAAGGFVGWRRFLKNTLALLVCVPVCILLGRGSLGHRPINPAMVAFAGDNLLNSLAVNSAYSVVFSVVQIFKEADAAGIYGKISDSEMLRIVKAARGRPESDYVSEKFPTLTENRASFVPGAGTRPRNIVIILEESFGARYIGCLGGEALSPNFDALAEEGWLFENCYCTGTRSVRGIEAVVTGFTPTPARSVVKLEKSQSGFFTVADFLKHKGYFTEFVYGSESHFDNMATFFLGNDFQKVIDERDFDEKELVSPKITWGVSDEDLFIRANKEFEAQNAAGTPFFALVFTTSNHDPFDVPARPGLEYKEPGKTRRNSAQYADYALGKFFELAKKSDYYKDTVFLVVADHDSRVAGANLMPVDRFKVPALILNAGKIARDSRLVSQIDLPPTLLSLTGVSGKWPMIGFDLTKPENPNRAMMQFDKNFAYMRGKGDGTADVVVLSGRKKIPLVYNLKTLEIKAAGSASADPELAATALAHAALGSYLYKNKAFPNFERTENEENDGK